MVYKGSKRRWSKSFRKPGSVKKYAQMAKPTAQAQKQQIVALADQVSTLRRVQRQGRQISQYQLDYSTTVSADYAVIDYVAPTTWTSVFADPPVMADACRVGLKNVKCDMLFTCNTEAAAIQFTCFLVTLKSDTADQLLSLAGSALGGLVAGRDYNKVATYPGLVHLNEQFFNIKKSWRFTIGQQLRGPAVLPTHNMSDTQKRIHFDISYNRQLNSGRLPWQTGLTSDRVSSQSKLYMLMFNDNSIVDLQSPLVSANTVFKVESF